MIDRANPSPAAKQPRTHNRSPRRRLRSVWPIVFGYVAACGLLLAGLAAAGVSLGVSAPTEAPAAGPAVTIASRGQELFITSCAACHGPQGAGTGNGPDLRNAGTALADFMLRTGRMPLADPGRRPGGERPPSARRTSRRSSPMSARWAGARRSPSSP